MIGTQNIMRATFGLLAVIGLSVAAGCGSGRPDTVRVTGTVTYKGLPVEGARVMFMRSGARPAANNTDAEGRFSLTTFEPDDGAVVGNHAVTITKSVAIDRSNPFSPHKQLLPLKYANPTSSLLKATVSAGANNDFHFDLSD